LLLPSYRQKLKQGRFNAGLTNQNPHFTGGKLPALQTPTEPDVTGRPKRTSRTTTTRATACSPRYHPEGQYRCIKAGTERLKKSFYLKAIRLLNSHQ
jgi:hypothetical protein